MNRSLRIFLPFIALLASSCATLNINPKTNADLSPAFVSVATYEFGQDNTQLLLIAKEVQSSQLDKAKVKWLESRLLRILKSNATRDAKDFACRQLSIIGTKRSVPTLKRLLFDEQLSDIARYALERIPCPAVDAALKSALAKGNVNLKIGALNSLAARGNSANISAVLTALDDPETGVVAAAAAALGELGGTEAASALKSLKDKKNAELSDVVADAYLKCADKLLKQGKADEASKIYAEMYVPSETIETRCAALKGLAASEKANASDRIIEALGSDTPALRDVAAQISREMPAVPPTKALTACLVKSATPVQILLLDVLASRKDSAALEETVKLVGSQEPEVRLAALQSLSSLGDRTTLPMLVETASTKTGGERDAARNALARVQGKDINSALIALISQTEAKGKSEIIRALASRKAVESTPTLLETAKDKEPQVAIESWKAIASLTTDKDTPALVALLAAITDDTVRPEAEKALIAICQTNSDVENRAVPMVSALDASSDDLVKGSLIRVLGRLGGAKALDAVLKAMKTDNKDLKDATVRSLSEWPDALAMDDLLRIAKTSDQEIRRVLALRGYIRLINVCDKPALDKVQMCKASMDLAKQPDEKRRALSALGEIKDPAALKMLEPYLDDKALSSEATAAVLKLVEPLSTQSSTDLKADLKKIIASSSEESVVKDAKKKLSSLDKYEDYATSWQITGPYMEGGKNGSALLAQAFPPETGTGNVEWKVLSTTDPAKPWYIDLAKIIGGNDRVVYLRAKVWSPTQQKARVELGSDDGVKVWVNGTEVIKIDGSRSFDPNGDKVDVSLKEGWNDLLMKVSNMTGPWCAALRVRASDGEHLEGIKYSAEY